LGKRISRLSSFLLRDPVRWDRRQRAPAVASFVSADGAYVGVDRGRQRPATRAALASAQRAWKRDAGRRGPSAVRSLRQALDGLVLLGNKVVDCRCWLASREIRGGLAGTRGGMRCDPRYAAAAW